MVMAGKKQEMKWTNGKCHGKKPVCRLKCIQKDNVKICLENYIMGIWSEC
jgi:hypothetical protein